MTIKDTGLLSWGPDAAISEYPSDGDLLVWNDALQKWLPTTSGGGGGAELLWSWNGTDASQFDPTPVATAGQTGVITVLPADASQNRPVPVLNIDNTYAGAGGAMAFKLIDGPTLPAKFRVVIGLTDVDSGTRGGPFFFNGNSWGPNLLGGGTTVGSYVTRQVIARPGAGFSPFDLPGSTPGFANVSTTESQGGYIAQMRITKLDGAGGLPPAFLARLTSDGSTTIPDATDSYTLTNGSFFGTGAQGSTPNAAFNDIVIDSFGLVFQSNSVGTHSVKIDRLEIWSD